MQSKGQSQLDAKQGSEASADSERRFQSDAKQGSETSAGSESDARQMQSKGQRQVQDQSQMPVRCKAKVRDSQMQSKGQRQGVRCGCRVID